MPRHRRAVILVTLLVSTLPAPTASAVELVRKPRPKPRTEKVEPVGTPPADATPAPASSVILATAIGGSAGAAAPTASPATPAAAEQDAAAPAPAPAPATLATPVASGVDSKASPPPIGVAASAAGAKTPVVVSLFVAAATTAALGTYFALAAHDSDARAALQRHESLGAGRYCSGTNGGGLCADAAESDARAEVERTAAIGLFAGAVAFSASALLIHLAWPAASKQVTVGAAVTPAASGASAIFRF